MCCFPVRGGHAILCSHHLIRSSVSSPFHGDHESESWFATTRHPQTHCPGIPVRIPDRKGRSKDQRYVLSSNSRDTMIQSYASLSVQKSVKSLEQRFKLPARCWSVFISRTCSCRPLTDYLTLLFCDHQPNSTERAVTISGNAEGITKVRSHELIRHRRHL